MADTKASAEPAASTVGPSDGWAIVQGGADKFMTVAQLAAAIGSGGGGVPMTASPIVNASDSSTSSLTFTTIPTIPSVSIPAKVGDIIEIEFNGAFYETTATSDNDFQYLVNGTGLTPTLRFHASATYPTETAVAFRIRRVVEAGDLLSGAFTVDIQWKTSGGTVHLIQGLTLQPLFTLKNFGDGSGNRGGSGNPLMFRAHATASVSFSTNIQTKVLFSTVDINAGDYFASSRFTPLVAGWYRVSGNAGTTATGSYFGCQLWKNGSQYNWGSNNPPGASGAMSAMSDVVYLNGSTDYIELYVQCGTGGSTIGDPTTDYFSGELIS